MSAPVLYRRHASECQREQREDKDCNCFLWIDWSMGQRRLHRSLGTRDWEVAKVRVSDMELRGFLASSAKVKGVPKHPHPERAKHKETRKAKVESQKHKCAICGRYNPLDTGWHLDHNHVTGQIRDALCRHCNALLGFALENETILLEAILYLRRHKALNPSIPPDCPLGDTL